MAEYHVTEQDQGMRIDQFLCKCQPDVSRSAIQKWIKDGNVLVQGKACKANYRINKGDTIICLAGKLSHQQGRYDRFICTGTGRSIHPATGYPFGYLI